MDKEIWVIEANLDSVGPFEYRVTTLERNNHSLKTSAGAFHHGEK